MKKRTWTANSILSTTTNLEIILFTHKTSKYSQQYSFYCKGLNDIIQGATLFCLLDFTQQERSDLPSKAEVLRNLNEMSKPAQLSLVG